MQKGRDERKGTMGLDWKPNLTFSHMTRLKKQQRFP